MPLSGIIASVATVVALAALVWCTALQKRLTSLRAVRGDLSRMAVEGDLTGFARSIDGRLRALEAENDHLREDDAALAERLSRAIRHVGLIRFDALAGDAGKQSFSMAILDDHANGAVLTSIYGRGEYRVYAKPIHEGRSEFSLADEETAAIEQGMTRGAGRREHA